MCGIVGIIDKKNQIKEVDLKKMTSTLKHRGPDSFGLWLSKINNINIGLGHRRLSILDLTNAGHQPMTFENVTISYNGEIYNFKEIKKELEELGYKFESNSDTEVLLKSYHQWGIKSLSKFNGMFAFVIVDSLKKKVFLCRDRLGVKPLYYFKTENNLLFGSEIKSILSNVNFKKKISHEALSSFLEIGYVPEPISIFKDIYKVPAGNYISVNLNDFKIDQIQYWDLESIFNRSKLKLSKDKLIKELEDIISSSCEYRMISDVPVGVFLSGGYDSTTVAAILQKNNKKKIKTFTIGFENKNFDESRQAKEIAKFLGTDHYTKILKTSESINLIQSIYNFYDEPLADDSIIPTMAVSKLAKENVTVALSADGADEIFLGYPKYREGMRIINRNKNYKLIQIIMKLVLMFLYKIQNISKNRLKWINFVIKKINSISLDNEGAVLKNIQSFFSKTEINSLLLNKPVFNLSNFEKYKKGDNSLDQFSLIDTKTYMLDNILVKVDRASMAFSLESREPMIDYRLVEYLAQVDSGQKFFAETYKYLLKEIVHKYVPKKLLDRPKKGFSLPISEWLKNPKFKKKYIEIYFSKQYVERQKLFSFSEIKRIMHDFYFEDKPIAQKKIWSLLMFQLWYDKWIKE